MPRLISLFLATTLTLIIPLAARADGGFYPIMADDGEIIANHRVPAALESQIEKLPGVIVVGNLHGKVTLNEFYDVNCPYCRQASTDIDTLLRAYRELRLALVPYPVLGIPSILGTRVELAVIRLSSAQTFYKFHRMLDVARGVVDGNRALSAAEAVGLDRAKVLEVANENVLGDIMTRHARLGDALGLRATPGFVIKGVAINGYPGPKALAKLIESVLNCGAVICEGSH